VLQLSLGAEQATTTLAGYIADIKPPQIEIMVLKKVVGFWEPIKLFGKISIGDSLSIENWCNKNSQVLSYVLVRTNAGDVRLDCSQVKMTFTEPGRFIPQLPAYVPSTPAIVTEVKPPGVGSTGFGSAEPATVSEQYACSPGYTYINGVCQPVLWPGYGNGVSGTVSGAANAAASGGAAAGPVGAIVGGALGTAGGAVQGTANMLTPAGLRCNAGYTYYNGACYPAR
jgi:hypothetical protein